MAVLKGMDTRRLLFARLQAKTSTTKSPTLIIVILITPILWMWKPRLIIMCLAQIIPRW